MNETCNVLQSGVRENFSSPVILICIDIQSIFLYRYTYEYPANWKVEVVGKVSFQNSAGIVATDLLYQRHTKTMSEPAKESANQRAARLRREKRNAKIQAEGSDRLAKITQLSGRPAPAPEERECLYIQ